jgi:hypothetical protein
VVPGGASSRESQTEVRVSRRSPLPIAVVALLLAAVSTLPAFADSLPVPDAITFTNKTGDVNANAHVLGHNATEVFYELPGGGARVKLAELPPSIQHDFHFCSGGASARESLSDSALPTFTAHWILR